MFLDIHTHHSIENEDVLAIENRHAAFGEPATSRYVSMGLHPWYIRPGTLIEELKMLTAHATDANVLAIGECGLDKLTTTDWELQCKAFEAQIALAHTLQKPLIIHCVKAFRECLSFLKDARVPVIFHGVNNRLSLVEPLIAAGFYLSFGRVLLSSSDAVLDTFKTVPLEQLFLETDDTGADICDIYKLASRLRNIPEKEIVLQLEMNFGKVFKR